MSSWFGYLGGRIASAFGQDAAGADDATGRGAVLAFRLLQNEAVRTELGLGLEQVGQILRLTREARTRRRKQFQSLKDQGRDKPGPESAKLAREVAVEVLGGLEKAATLTTAQKERLRQVTWQRQGAAAFADPFVQTALDITPAQSEVIRAMVMDAGARIEAAVKDGEAGPRARQDAVAAVRRENQEKALALLSAGQRTRWDELIGKAFDLELPDAAGGPQGGE